MFTSACRAALVVLLACGPAACEIEAPEFRFGIPLGDLSFVVDSPDAGIHPNDDVLGDPNNPFARFDFPGLEARFAIRDTAGPVASFYAWASALAIEPNGENQFYTAEALEVIFQAELAPEEQLPTVREMAIRAYQSQLDNFPDAVSFVTEEASTFFRLATESYLGIQRLGARVQGDWVLVVDPDGNPVAVRGSNTLDPPNPLDDAEDEFETPGGG